MARKSENTVKSTKTAVPEPGTLFYQEEESFYTIHGEIRRGGMGAIMLVRDHEVERDVAMKLLLGDDVLERKRFVQEARVTGSLEHPNIVPIHAMGHDKQTQQLFFTMKLVDGENLREILQHIKKQTYAEKDWSWTRLLHIFTSICHAIEFAHSRHVIHRDLKPSNIMVGKFGEVQVMDWGLAKDISKKDSGKKTGTDSSQSRHAAANKSDARRRRAQRSHDDGRNGEDGSGQWTLDGDVVGTIVYMPPEQALGLVHKIDRRSDVYSLGAILYEILCLCPPIAGEGVAERLEKVENNAIEWPSELTPERKIPRDLCHVVMKALSREPRDRYQSVEALREDIQRFLELRPIEGAVPSKLDSAWKFLRRHSGVSIVVGISGLLLMFVFFVMYVATAHERSNAVAAQQNAETNLKKYRDEQMLKEQAESEKRALDLQMARDAQRNWQRVSEETFPFPSDDWSVLGNTDIKTEIKDQQLLVNGGKPYVLMYTPPVTGDMKLEFDVRLAAAESTEKLNEIGCFILAYRENDLSSMSKNGYYFKRGNKTIELTRGEEVLYTHACDPLQANVKYHISVERIANSLSMAVNGEEVFRITDPHPLYGMSRNRIGLSGAQGNAYYDNIQVYGLAQSRKVDVLELADYYMNQGNYQTAEDIYDIVSKTASDPERLARASNGLSVASTYKRKKTFMNSYMRQAERAFATAPRISLTDDGLVLDAAGLEVVDLKAIQGASFNYIDLSHTNVKNITALRSMPLTYLNISNSLVEDLSPLSSSPLQHLDAHATRIQNIDALQGLQLHYLDLSDTAVVEISAVKGMPLRVLLAGNSTVEDPQIFAAMPLTSFALTGRHIKSGDFLRGKKLYTLSINGTGISNLNFAHEMPLEELQIARTPIVDLSPVLGKVIQRLNIESTHIKDFQFLKKMKLNDLNVSHTAFSDVSLIATSQINTLNLNHTLVKDIVPLRNCASLQHLWLLGCDVQSLEPLSSLTLEGLALSPQQLPKGWEIILQSLHGITGMYGNAAEIEAGQVQSAASYIKHAQAGLYE